ncbi:Profilin [Pristimantis euphronides]
MSWQDYIDTLVSAEVQDACICGFNPPSVWAARPGGFLARITAAEILALVASDRSCLFINGATLGGVRCSMIRDNMEDSKTMDLRTKSQEDQSVNVSVAQTNTALIILMGCKGVHGGMINDKAHCMAKYLRDQNM